MATILVTGAEGFIGSHLTEYLLSQGHKVRALVLYNSFGQEGWLSDLAPEARGKLEICWGDVRDGKQMLELVHGCDWVMHLAALIAIPYSYQAAASYLATNVQGTLNILEAAKQAQCERILVTSTSEVYGTAQYVPIDEKHPLQPQSPYSASKIAADSLALSFYHSFDLPVSLVRPFNTYGPRQSARAIIPSIIGQLLQGKSVLKLGDLRPTRDLLFVEDLAKAYLAIAESPHLAGKTLNVATGKELSMQALTQQLIQMIRPGAGIEQDPQRLRPVNSEVQRLCGDASLLQSKTHWRAETDLARGLAKTIAWFRDRPKIWRAAFQL